MLTLSSKAVSCLNELLKNRVQSIVQLALTTVSSLTEVYGGRDSSTTLCKLDADGISEAKFLKDEDENEEAKAESDVEDVDDDAMKEED